MKLSTKMISLILVEAASVIMISSCGPYSGSRTLGTPKETNQNLVYLNAALTLQIPCEKIEAQKLESGRTKIYARFQNNQNFTAECQIKVKFKNDSGRVVDETGWMPFVLPRREVVQFEHTSLSTDVKDFTLMLRQAK